MGALLWVIVILVVLAIVGVAVWGYTHKQRTEQLRGQLERRGGAVREGRFEPDGFDELRLVLVRVVRRAPKGRQMFLWNRTTLLSSAKRRSPLP